MAGGSVLRRFASGLLFFIGCCQLTISQGLSPLTPAKEYIRLNDQTIAIENAQVVADGTFETDSLGPWAILAGGASIGTAAHTGAYSLALGGTTATSWVYQDASGFIPGSMYEVSVWVKSSIATTNGVQLWLHDTQGNGSISTVAYPGTGWQQISGAFTATATGQLRIHLIQLPGTAETTYWDDVTVTPLPPNRDFETASLTPWLIYGGNALLSNTSHSGFYGAALGGTTAQTLLYQDVAGLVPGQMYQVSAWVKSSIAATNGVELWLHDTQENGSVANLVSPDTDWQQFSTAFTATSIGKLRIHLMQVSGTAETTYWDDVTVTPLPPNGDFETGTLSPWAIIAGDAAIGTTAHSGAYGAALGGGTVLSWIYQDVAGLIPGQSYQVSTWVKASSSAANSIEIWLHDTQGNGSSYLFFPTGVGWQRFSVPFTATVTGKLRIHLLQAGNSITTYWDDVVVAPQASGGAMMMATPSSSVAAPYAFGPNTKFAAGSSKDAAKPISQVSSIPAGTATAKGSSAVLAIPVNQTSPPQ
jgi:hypothetical protein